MPNESLQSQEEARTKNWWQFWKCKLNKECAMHVGTVKKFLIYSIYLIFVLITFVPRLYVKLHDPNATLPFGFDSFMEVLDPVAVATIILATATFALVKDSSKNIEISKNNLLEDHLVREMNELIKPIYLKRDKFEYLEFVHNPYYYETRYFQEWKDEACDFWDRLETSEYLASKDLRDLIKDYSQTNKEWHHKHDELANRIKEGLTRESKIDLCEEAPKDRLSLGFFDYRFMNLPTSNDRAERKQKIKDLTDQLDADSYSFSLIGEFVNLIDEDTVLEAKRTIFKAKVIDRYEKLEKMIDEIRDTLEKNS